MEDADTEMFSQFVNKKALIVMNKQDLGLLWSRDGAIPVSATTGAGLDDLRSRILESLDFEAIADRPAVTNVRHMALVERAHDALLRAERRACRRADRCPRSSSWRICRTRAQRSKRLQASARPRIC